MSWAGGDLQTGGARPPSAHSRAVPPPRRMAAMQQGLKTAVRVPCALAEKVSGLWPALKELAHHCNLACKSDIQVWPRLVHCPGWGFGGCWAHRFSLQGVPLCPDLRDASLQLHLPNWPVVSVR